MPTPNEMLRGEQEAVPPWLLRADKLDAETLKSFLASRVVFYPGAGTDWPPIKLFGLTNSAHCFVHADYGISAMKVRSQLKTILPGYKPIAAATEILKADAFPDRLRFDLEQHFGGKKRPKNALFAILERDTDRADEHGPRRIAFLHICAEATCVYYNLWDRGQSFPPSPFAVILQDHGFGGNWMNDGHQNCFGGEDLLFSMARGAFLSPPWLLVAENTKEWPGYDVASGWSEPAGDHGIRRRLWRLRQGK